MINIFRKAVGYVTVRITGGFCERFFTSCCENGIKLWNICDRGDRFTACVRAKQYRKLRRHARKYGVRIRVELKRGLPFYIAAHKWRVGIPAGLAAFAALLVILSQFCWEIEISGNESLTRSQILYALERCGVGIGTPMSAIDADAVKLKMMLELSDISWVALNRRGTSVYLELRERVLPPDVLPGSHPCNVVARYTGQIVQYRVYDGQPAVQEGEGVAAGQLLISGVITDREGAVVFTHARGSVKARVRLVKNVAVDNLRQTVTPSEKSRTVYDICIFGLKIPLYFSAGEFNEFTVVSEEKLRLLGRCYPFSIRKTVFYDREIQQARLTPEQAEQACIQLLAEYEATELSGAQIVGLDTAVLVDEEKTTVTAVYECVLDIGVEKEFYIKQEADAG